MKIAIYGSRRQQPYAEAIKSLLRRLVLSGIEVEMDRKLYIHLTGDLGLNLAGVTMVADAQLQAGDDAPAMVLSIGGDGTFLRAAAWVGASGIPVLGINTGHLGYLSAISIDQAQQLVDDLIAGDFDVTPRSLIAVDCPGLRGWPYALNEVAMTKDDTTSMIEADAALNGQPLARYAADGLIVATPTGSTAYNLSVGGPIVQPSAPVWVISPIAAHSLSLRPLVVDDSSLLDVTVNGRARTFRVSLDGRFTTVPMGAEVHLSRAPFTLNIVSKRGMDFTQVLRAKLLFN